MKASFDKAKWQSDQDGTWFCCRVDHRSAVKIVGDIQPEKRYDLEVKLHRERRSLSANSYYWVVLPKLAEKLNISKPAAHNLMLRRYGQLMMFGDRVGLVVLPDSDEMRNDVLEMSDFHVMPTSNVRPGKDGTFYRTYRMLKGSHEFDTREMSILIDGLVGECKALGIETLPPDELARLEGYVAQADKGA